MKKLLRIKTINLISASMRNLTKVKFLDGQESIIWSNKLLKDFIQLSLFMVKLVVERLTLWKGTNTSLLKTQTQQLWYLKSSSLLMFLKILIHIL